MNKILLIFLVLLTGACTVNAQTINENIYFLDKDWKPTLNRTTAKYYVRNRHLNDTTWVRDYYNNNGPKIKQGTYRDEQGEIPNGFFSYYNADGMLDSCGYQAVAGQEGEWIYFNGGDYSGKKIFDNGILKEVISAGAGGDTGKVKYIVEKEAEFNGGDKARIKFLNKNLRYPMEAIDYEISGTVWILFIVDQQGKISKPIIQHSVAYPLDEEGFRIVQLLPDWIPASQAGQNVASYKRFELIWKLR